MCILRYLNGLIDFYPGDFRFRRSILLWIVMSVMIGLLTSCAGHKIYKPHPELIGHKEIGLASCYALNTQFRKTACGEMVDNSSMKAAHRSLPFGTQVIVKNLRNGKTVKVSINDRGPYIRGRIIDLSRAAFAEIADLKRGVAKVEITVID